MRQLLSIVLPVYDVEQYLGTCLDSVLAQTGAELEVIAVDDCSPDGSGEILDTYAQRDPRLRVLHLDHQHGLGGARAAGLAEATGEYVWFVDSDDWVADGAVAAVAERLTAARPDVLITDYMRSFPDGDTEPNLWRRLMTEPPAPPVFTLQDRPQTLQMIMSVWNKVIRREFLLGLGVTFGPGFYEDISVTYPLLMAAQRLSYLDVPCYFYRRLREGAITHTTSPRHMEVFAQYDRIFAFIDRFAPADANPALPDTLRREVFERTVKHALTIYSTPRLLPAASRGEFLRRTAGHIRRHRPVGYSFPRGSRGLQYRMAARGAKAPYDTLLVLDALRRRGRRGVQGASAGVSRIARTARGALRYAYYQACLRLPQNDHLAVYAAYWYRGFACNPAAVYLKARELCPSVQGVWVIARRDLAASLPDGVPYVVENTPAYFKAMATAKYLINNVNFPHVTPKRPGSVHVQTQHGTPLKKLGLDLRAHPQAAAGMDFDRLLEHVNRWDYLVTPNPHSTQAFSQAYPGRYEVLETGYPRNDRFSTTPSPDSAAIRRRLGIGPHTTAILYAPTYREQHPGRTCVLDITRFAQALGPQYTILVRSHYFSSDAQTSPAGQPTDPERARVLDVSVHPSVEDLCLAADMLITDYSSLMFDFAVLDRPLVIYAPDWEEYRRVRGVYFDLTAAPPGIVTTVQEDLADAIRTGRATSPAANAARAAFRTRFCPYDDGEAAERVVRRVFPVSGR
jgi:CDP-glycerol glycerophosphotransferase